MNLDHVHPKFRAWFADQDDATKADILATYEATGNDPDLGGDPRNRIRLYYTLAFAHHEYGYDFTA